MLPGGRSKSVRFGGKLRTTVAARPIRNRSSDPSVSAALAACSTNRWWLCNRVERFCRGITVFTRPGAGATATRSHSRKMTRRAAKNREATVLLLREPRSCRERRRTAGDLRPIRSAVRKTSRYGPRSRCIGALHFRNSIFEISLRASFPCSSPWDSIRERQKDSTRSRGLSGRCTSRMQGVRWVSRCSVR